jgi:hypothetical protein
MRHVASLLGAILLAGCGSSQPTPPAVAAAPAPPATATASPAAPTVDRHAEKTTESPAAPAAWPFAPPSAEELNEQRERLARDPGPIKSNWTPPGRSARYGHAEGMVAAPLDAVRARLVDFGRYKDLAGPKFKNVRVVDRQGDATDVYFQLPIMKGLVTIWYVTRFLPARNDVVEGTFVKGNIKDMHIALAVRPGASEKSSIMVCDLVLAPTIPAPQAAIDEELRDACGDAIVAVRKTLAP